MDRIFRLEARFDNLTEQVRVDHQHLLIGLDAQHRALLSAMTQGLARQHQLLTEHVRSTESRFAEIGETVKDLARATFVEVTSEIERIKQRLDRLENPPAA